MNTIIFQTKENSVEDEYICITTINENELVIEVGNQWDSFETLLEREEGIRLAKVLQEFYKGDL